MSIAPLFVNSLAVLHSAAVKRKAQASELEPWQVEDAARLKALLDQARKSRNWPGQDAFASEAINRSGSYLTQLATAYRPLNVKHAVALARRLRVKVRDISPTLADQVAALGSPDEPAGRKKRAETFEGAAARTARYTLHGMQISTEEVEVGIEWGKLDEPTKSVIRDQILLAVASQVRRRRGQAERTTPQSDTPDNKH